MLVCWLKQAVWKLLGKLGGGGNSCAASRTCAPDSAGRSNAVVPHSCGKTLKPVARFRLNPKAWFGATRNRHCNKPQVCELPIACGYSCSPFLACGKPSFTVASGPTTCGFHLHCRVQGDFQVSLYIYTSLPTAEAHLFAGQLAAALQTVGAPLFAEQFAAIRFLNSFRA